MSLEPFLEEMKKKTTPKNIKKIFIEIYRRTGKFKILLDFFGEILLEYPYLLNEKNHSKILKGYSEFLIESKIAYKHLDLLKMEKKLIEKYCLLDNEDLLLFFDGTLVFKKVLFMYRIYLTSYRIIVLSNAWKGGGLYNRWFGLFYNLTVAIQKSIINQRMKSAV
ncbi:MAG: hypothetical protein ACXAAI_12205, partial [Promethearchaeota archaeon]